MPPVPRVRTTAPAVRQISSETELKFCLCISQDLNGYFRESLSLGVLRRNFNRVTAYGEGYIKRSSDTGSIPVGSTSPEGRAAKYRGSKCRLASASHDGVFDFDSLASIKSTGRHARWRPVLLFASIAFNLPLCKNFNSTHF